LGGEHNSIVGWKKGRAGVCYGPTLLLFYRFVPWLWKEETIKGEKIKMNK